MPERGGKGIVLAKAGRPGSPTSLLRFQTAAGVDCPSQSQCPQLYRPLQQLPKVERYFVILTD